jgi:hypothetical protein
MASTNEPTVLGAFLARFGVGLGFFLLVEIASFSSVVFGLSVGRLVFGGDFF